MRGFYWKRWLSEIQSSSRSEGPLPVGVQSQNGLKCCLIKQREFKLSLKELTAFHEYVIQLNKCSIFTLFWTIILSLKAIWRINWLFEVRLTRNTQSAFSIRDPYDGKVTKNDYKLYFLYFWKYPNLDTNCGFILDPWTHICPGSSVICWTWARDKCASLALRDIFA